jgi:hypothetical protein
MWYVSATDTSPLCLWDPILRADFSALLVRASAEADGNVMWQNFVTLAVNEDDVLAGIPLLHVSVEE